MAAVAVPQATLSGAKRCEACCLHEFCISRGVCETVGASHNALEGPNMQRILETISGKRLVIFLDYDGTLSPIVRDPDKAFMSDSMRATLREVAAKYTTSIVTGRTKEKVMDFVKLDNLVYAGSHGFDIRGPQLEYVYANRFLPLLGAARQQLQEAIAGIKGCFLEDNKFSISVHYRQVDPEDWAAVRQTVERVCGSVEAAALQTPDAAGGAPAQLAVHGGKMVWEVRPKVEWNKGKAVMWLLRALKLADSPNVIPFYFGDDVTDEDAFGVLSGLGIGIMVRDIESQTRVTKASWSLRGPAEVQRFLQKLVAIA